MLSKEEPAKVKPIVHGVVISAISIGIGVCLALTGVGAWNHDTHMIGMWGPTAVIAAIMLIRQLREL